ncbi:hypothetical protein IH979_01145, partial [Patescibacteria group bacterium]|nr:hypothetical protein [Patescibacteria group bacterium]
VSKHRFDASDEAFVVDRLTVTEEEAEDDGNGTDSNAYANNISKVTISFPMSDGTTGSASGALTGNERTFEAIDFFIGKDDHAEVTTSVDVSVSDRSGGSATSNEEIRMGLSVDTSLDDQFRARGQSSGETLDDDDVTVSTANDGMDVFPVRETRPTISLSASSPSGSGFVPGDQEVFRFNIAVHSNEDFVLEEVLFKLSSTDNSASSWNLCDQGGVGAGEIAESDFDLYNLSTTGTTTALDEDADWTLLTSDATECTDSTDLTSHALLELGTGDEETIPAGATHTLALYFDSTGASSADDDSVQFEIPTDPILSSASFLAGSDLTGALAATATTVPVTSSSAFSIGDIACMDTADDGCGTADEKMLVVAIPDGTSLSVVRGYLDTAIDPAGNAATDDVDRLPGSLLWQDDGSTIVTTATEERWGSHLIDDLPVTGNPLGF